MTMTGIAQRVAAGRHQVRPSSATLRPPQLSSPQGGYKPSHPHGSVLRSVPRPTDLLVWTVSFLLPRMDLKRGFWTWGPDPGLEGELR